MLKKIPLLIILGIITFVFVNATIPLNIFKITYQVVYHPNLDNLEKVKTEDVLLFTDGKSPSFYVAKNFLWRDSLSQLVSTGKITSSEMIGHPDYPKKKTDFKHFIIKNYNDKKITVLEKLVATTYEYQEEDKLDWTISNDTLRIHSYLCYKAKAFYGGRNYEAWFTPEIAISDGPYKFRGLPGLIINIKDTENHYVFTMKEIEKFEGQPSVMHGRNKKLVQISSEKFKVLQRETKENPMKAFNEIGLKKIIIEGKEMGADELRRRIPKYNYIERL